MIGSSTNCEISCQKAMKRWFGDIPIWTRPRMWGPLNQRSLWTALANRNPRIWRSNSTLTRSRPGSISRCREGLLCSRVALEDLLHRKVKWPRFRITPRFSHKMCKTRNSRRRSKDRWLLKPPHSMNIQRLSSATMIIYLNFRVSRTVRKQSTSNLLSISLIRLRLTMSHYLSWSQASRTWTSSTTLTQQRLSASKWQHGLLLKAKCLESAICISDRSRTPKTKYHSSQGLLLRVADWWETRLPPRIL